MIWKYIVLWGIATFSMDPCSPEQLASGKPCEAINGQYNPMLEEDGHIFLYREGFLDRQLAEQFMDSLNISIGFSDLEYPTSGHPVLVMKRTIRMDSVRIK